MVCAPNVMGQAATRSHSYSPRLYFGTERRIKDITENVTNTRAFYPGSVVTLGVGAMIRDGNYRRETCILLSWPMHFV
jgi:hypothetical protein